MKKFLKTLSVITAAVVSLAAAPMISEKAEALDDSKPDYYMDSDNIAWSDDYFTVYNDGSVLNIFNQNCTLSLKTADGFVPTAENLGLPEGTEISDVYYNGGVRVMDDYANYFISVENIEDMPVLAGMSEKWLEEGIVEQAGVRLWCGYCCNFGGGIGLLITLKDDDKGLDINSFEGLEKVTLEEFDTKSGKEYQTSGIDPFIVRDVLEKVRADENVESAEISCLMCEVVHTMYKEYTVSEYLSKYSEPEVPSTEPTEVPSTEPTEVPSTEPTEATTSETKAPVTTAIIEVPVISDDILSKTDDIELPDISFDNTDDYCDINNDDITDLYDLIMIAKYMLKTVDFNDAEFKTADVDKNGVVDLYDAILVAKFLLLENLVLENG